MAIRKPPSVQFVPWLDGVQAGSTVPPEFTSQANDVALAKLAVQAEVHYSSVAMLERELAVQAKLRTAAADLDVAFVTSSTTTVSDGSAFSSMLSPKRSAAAPVAASVQTNPSTSVAIAATVATERSASAAISAVAYLPSFNDKTTQADMVSSVAKGIHEVVGFRVMMDDETMSPYAIPNTLAGIVYYQVSSGECSGILAVRIRNSYSNGSVTFTPKFQWRATTSSTWSDPTAGSLDVADPLVFTGVSGGDSLDPSRFVTLSSGKVEVSGRFIGTTGDTVTIGPGEDTEIWFGFVMDQNIAADTIVFRVASSTSGHFPDPSVFISTGWAYGSVAS